MAQKGKNEDEWKDDEKDVEEDDDSDDDSDDSWDDEYWEVISVLNYSLISLL